jgi:hypothetical protein
MYIHFNKLKSWPAIRSRWDVIINLLMKKGANVNEECCDGWTALYRGEKFKFN